MAKLKPLNLNDAYNQIVQKHESLGLPYAPNTEIKDLIAKSQNLDLPPGDRLFTIEQASSILGVSPQTLRNWEENGMLVPVQKTTGGHRRYSEEQLNEVRKKKMGNSEIILPNIKPGRLIELFQQMLSVYDPEQNVQLTIQVDVVDKKVRFVLDSEDGLTTTCKSFKMED